MSTRVAVIGAGSFGKNHARVYHELQQAGEQLELAAIVDADIEKAKSIAAPTAAKAYASVAQMLSDPGSRVTAASVAVPTIHHLEVSRELMRAGVDVLIEKPLAASMNEADELSRLQSETGRIVQVGHLERFNPAVRATYPLVTQPMFFEVHRLSLFGPRALDVDVVLDLMIHDIDIVLSLVKSPIRDIRAVGLPVLSPKVDIANVRIEFESGCVANLTASRISTERVRKMRFFQPQQYVSVDYGRQDLLVFTVGGQSKTAPGKAKAEAGFDLSKLMGDPEMIAAAAKALSGAAVLAQAGISMSKPPVEQEEPLRAELRSFLKAVRDRSVPHVSLEEGRTALKVCLEIVSKIDEHMRRFELSTLNSKNS